MKAFVIAGGVAQIELLRQLKERGIVTILADGNPNAVARPCADIFYHVNIFDVPAIWRIAEQEKVDFLITVCADQVLLVVAEVSELLGLPCYIDYKTARNMSDKTRMKRIFKENGIPTTDYLLTDSLEDLKCAPLRFPLVVKPVDAYSSRGVRKAKNETELARFYAEAQAISRRGGVIVEDYFDGEEISVDAFVVGGKARVLTVTNSDKLLDDDRFIIFRGRYPAEASEALRQQIQDIAQKIADGFGLVNAPLLIQLLHKGDQVTVLEACARTGGNMKWLLIQHTCGVDVIRATIDITLGLEPELTCRDTGHRIVVNDYLYCRPGVFDHFEGFEEMAAQGLLHEFRASRSRGFEVCGVTSSSDRIAGMNIVADSPAEFNEKEKTILEHVKVLDSRGNDMLRRDLLPPLE